MTTTHSVPLFLLLLSLVAWSTQASDGAPRRISRETARKIVFRAVNETTSWPRLPRFGLDPYDDRSFSQFYWFEAQWDNPIGSVVLSHYAVNSVTADVWETGMCRRFELGWLKKAQRRLRERSGLSGSAFGAKSNMAPCEHVD